MTPNSHNLIYIVTDTDYDASHITMIGPEQFIHWIETEIIFRHQPDGQIMGLADLLIIFLRRQIEGETTHQLVISTAKELDLHVTVIAGAILADWNE